MPVLQTLIKRTLPVTVFRGHTMGSFATSKNGNGGISECTVCKALAIITTKPQPNGIGGHAMALNCPATEE
jgi:hypothetical protein